MLEKGLLDGDCLTVTGKTLGENVSVLPGLKAGQKIVHPLEDPIKATGHIQILYGNLGAGRGPWRRSRARKGIASPARPRVYDCEEDMLHALEQNKIAKGDVIIIRYEGPKGGTRHARNADADVGHHGRRSGKRRGSAH